jgi:uncharacterized protein YhbP (UPF0306 family)
VEDPAAHARALIDANLYMVLATADPNGLPWAAPVYYAPSEYREFFWVSKPEARHSRNIAERPEVSIVIFDSSVPIGTGQGVYMSAHAEELEGGEREHGTDVFSRRSLAHGGSAFALEDTQEPARLRLFRATAIEQYVLDEHDLRVPVPL